MLRLSLSQLFGRRDWQEDVSAYLDDELTLRERERVEARLAESEEARAYLDDLRRMRSALRGFAAGTSRAPFQLSVEMLEGPIPTQLRPSPIERALRVSMATAAVGIATFSAVLVFDVIDQPSVSFSQGFADDTPTSVPTVEIVTEQVQQQAQQGMAASAPPPVTVASIEAAEQAEQADMEEAQQNARAWAEPLEQEAMQAEQEWQQQAYQQQAFDQAAADPARRGINARGQRAASGDEDVDAADVVAQQEQQTADVSSSALTSSTDSSADESMDERPAAQASVEHSDDSASAAAAPRVEQETRIETRTVATSVRHTESDWPLEQRPRTTSVRLAADPSWEQPLQIALATIAVAATLAWLCLTMMDRRRRT